jgi:hypothetical protein
MLERASQSYTWFLLRHKFRKPWFWNWGSWQVPAFKISRDEWSKQWLTSATSAAVTSWPLTSFHICYSALCLAHGTGKKIRQPTLISSSRQSPLLVLRHDINKQECVSYRIPALAPFIYARDSFSSVKALGLSTMNMDWNTVRADFSRNLVFRNKFHHCRRWYSLLNYVYKKTRITFEMSLRQSDVYCRPCTLYNNVLFTLWPRIFPFHVQNSGTGVYD